MRNQTFELKNSGKGIGYISKNSSNDMLLQLNGYWGTLKSGTPAGKIVNVDDFVGSVVCSDTTAVIKCLDGKTVVFDAHIYAGITEIRVYDDIVGLVYQAGADGVVDVTGKVIIPE